MAKMSKPEWDRVRAVWEGDPRPGYVWIVREMGLPVSAPAVRKRATKGSWAKESIASSHSVPATKNTGKKLVDFRPELPGQVYRLALLGLTKAQTAEVIGISERTFHDWLCDRAEIAESWFKGGAYADAQVARALYQRATGAVTPDTHVTVINEKVTITPLDKHHPPETRAAFLWLKNRRGEYWKDKVEVEQPPTIALVDKEKMDELYERALKQAAEIQERMVGRAERLGLVLDEDMPSTE